MQVNFNEVLEALKSGKKVSLPEWKGYWKLEHGKIMAHCADGLITEATQFQPNVFRSDWIIL